MIKNGTKQNGTESKKRTERSRRGGGEIEKEMK